MADHISPPCQPHLVTLIGMYMSGDFLERLVQYKKNQKPKEKKKKREGKGEGGDDVNI